MSLHSHAHMQPHRLTLDQVPDRGVVKIEALRIAAPGSVVLLGVSPVVVTGEEASRLRLGLRGSVIEDALAHASPEGLMGIVQSDDAARALVRARLPERFARIVGSWNADMIAVHFRQ